MGDTRGLPSGLAGRRYTHESLVRAGVKALGGGPEYDAPGPHKPQRSPPHPSHQRKQRSIAVQECGGSHSSPKLLKPGWSACFQIHKTGFFIFLLFPKCYPRKKQGQGHSCSPPWCHRMNGRWEVHFERPAGLPRTHRRGSAPGVSCEW